MYLIKRYSNRKLYDTVKKRYVTLGDIADLVANNRDVKVVDNETGADLTTLTLSQVIYEQEKRQQGFLPKSLLSNLIQKGGDFLDRLPQSLHSFLNPQESDDLEKLIQSWVQEGLLALKDVDRIRKDLLFHFGDNKIKNLLVEVLREWNLPTQAELEKFRTLLSQLEALVERKSKAQAHSDEGG